MVKVTVKEVLMVVSALLVAGGVSAAPVALTDAQMDEVAAGGVERVDGFVCPVITTDGVLNSPNGAAIADGHYTIIGPDVAVPLHATNGDGAGSPGGSHSQPGDTDYTAVWAR